MTIKKTKGKKSEPVSRKRRKLRTHRRLQWEATQARRLELSIRGHASVEVDGEEVAELGARAWASMPRPSSEFAGVFLSHVMPILASMLPGVDVSPPGEHHAKCPNKPRAPEAAPDVARPDFGGVGDPEFCSVARRLDSKEEGEHPYTAPELLAPCVHLVGHIGPHRFETWETRRAVGWEIFGKRKAPRS